MEEQFFVRPFVTLIVAMTSCLLQATTIVPFANLGTLADGSDALVMARVIKVYEHSEDDQVFFRFRLVVEESIKGSLEKGDQFDVQKWEKLTDDKWMTMWGDINLYQNTSYLLFLEDRGGGLYHPLCFSYYIFEEVAKDGFTYLVPSPESAEIEVLDLNTAEPLYVYTKEPLMKQLSSYVHDQKPWNSNEAKTSLSISDFTNQQSKRSAPSGCTFLNTSGKKVRWNIFPDLSVGVHYNSGATGCGSSVSAAQDAISTLQNAYDGINILDAGSSTFSANCADFSALGADYRSYMDNTYGNYRHVIIQFEDPCSEISDLKSCGGTLAIGGAYGVGSHTYLDTAWATAKYGYVVVNNGVGNCFCSSMTDLLTHELTHTLGLGHISANVGTANLNPVCCHSITALDNQCVDYAYPPPGAVQLLPVELVSFNGVADPYYNQLFWSTASEQNVNRFIIERANSNGSQFETIGAVLSQGETSVGHAYEWLDKSPMQNNYYRLRTTDWDGQEDLSNIIVVKRQEGLKPAIYPTMTNGEINIAIPGGEEVRLKIFSVAGELISEYNIAYSSAIDLKDLVNGWYLIRLENANFSEIFRVLKI